MVSNRPKDHAWKHCLACLVLGIIARHTHNNLILGYRSFHYIRVRIASKTNCQPQLFIAKLCSLCPKLGPSPIWTRTWAIIPDCMIRLIALLNMINSRLIFWAWQFSGGHPFKPILLMVILLAFFPPPMTRSYQQSRLPFLHLLLYDYFHHAKIHGLDEHPLTLCMPEPSGAIAALEQNKLTESSEVGSQMHSHYPCLLHWFVLAMITLVPTEYCRPMCQSQA